MAGQQFVAAEARGTTRQKMIALLRQGPMDRRQISQALGIQEKEVARHLPHVAKSVAARNMQWVVEPAYCENCDFEFKNRRRLSRPGKCPRCRHERIHGPWFHIRAPSPQVPHR